MKELKIIGDTTKRDAWLKEGWEYIDKEFVTLRQHQIQQANVQGIRSVVSTNAVIDVFSNDGEADMVVEVVGNNHGSSGDSQVDISELEEWKRFVVKSWQKELDGKVVLEPGSAISMMMLWRHVDILDWWRRYEHEFPTIALLARRFLACPAAQSFQERVFSGAKVVMNAKRSRLDSDLFEQLVVLRHNQKWLERQRQGRQERDEQSASKKVKVEK